jgi:uncharacterized protein YdeI (YjbR/CyaY-like superfamily)
MKMNIKEINTFCPADKKEWREWLEKNHFQAKSVWLIYYKKNENGRLLTWSEAVDEALCFGWIDGLSKKLDNERYMQFFTQRKPTSAWSKINKAKVERLTEEGLMKQSGLDAINIAKNNGSWTILNQVEELIVPDELQHELSKNPQANSFFVNLSKSDRRNLLQWLVLAKRTETRQKRVQEIIKCAQLRIKPKIIQWKKTDV